jgi:ribonuclease J
MDGRILVLTPAVPQAEMPGVDLVLPDFEYLRQHADEIEAVVLTHGHEDHVGTLPPAARVRPQGLCDAPTRR